jgi:hypothetical protein
VVITPLIIKDVKRRLLLAALVIAVGVILLWLANGSSTTLNMKMALIGFDTNYPSAKTPLLIRVSNVKLDVAWHVHALEQNVSGGWHGVPAPISWSSFPDGPDYIIRVPVASTNGLWRAILYCQERRGGIGGIMDRTEEVFARVFRDRHYAIHNGSKHRVTNDLLN